MPPPQLPNYLRSNRKRLVLSQDEVAFLLGTQSGTRVCRDERFNREPSLKTALAYEAIFRKPVHDLFKGLSKKIEGEIVGRAKTLARRIKKLKHDRLKARKLKAVEDIMAALSHKSNRH